MANLSLRIAVTKGFVSTGSDGNRKGHVESLMITVHNTIRFCLKKLSRSSPVQLAHCRNVGLARKFQFIPPEHPVKSNLILLAVTLAFAVPNLALSEDTELKVQRRTHDREDKSNRANNVNHVTRGLSFTVKNTGLGDAAEGEVEWAILVVRPAMGKHLLSSGKETLQALKFGETASFAVGSVPMQEAGSNRQDMEYQVVVRRGGIEAAKVESTASFDEMAASARGVRKKAKGGKNK